MVVVGWSYPFPCQAAPLYGRVKEGGIRCLVRPPDLEKSSSLAVSSLFSSSPTRMFSGSRLPLSWGLVDATPASAAVGEGESAS